MNLEFGFAPPGSAFQHTVSGERREEREERRRDKIQLIQTFDDGK